VAANSVRTGSAFTLSLMLHSLPGRGWEASHGHLLGRRRNEPVGSRIRGRSVSERVLLPFGYRALPFDEISLPPYQQLIRELWAACRSARSRGRR
jgi:hypothetical protein